MLKIKSLTLQNYAGFKNLVNFNFTNSTDFKPINMFFGPNGCGKSTALQAISVLGRAKAYAKRNKNESNLLLRKLQFHPDYDPSYAGYTKYQDSLNIDGVFTDGDRDYRVVIRDDDVICNDLADRKSDNTVYIDADNPINLAKFQVPRERSILFIELAKSIYGYNCFLEKPVNSSGVSSNHATLKEVLFTYADTSKEKIGTNEHQMSKTDMYNYLSKDNQQDEFAFYQDFVIEKGDVKVHYKSMSAGEKKIATLLRNLCDPTVMDKSDIVLVDNIEMHVYFKRHQKMIDKLIEFFPSKQFIVTSHSGIMIEHVGKTYGKECLYDITEYKDQKLID
jgi:AAA15 family ATPase/GTPase